MRISKCAHFAEWEAARYYRQTYFFDKVSVSDPYTWTFDHPDHIHFVLYESTEIIGYSHIQLWPESRAAMRIVVINPAKRSKGFGKQFLLLIEEWLKNQKYKNIHVESSPGALSFYKRNGYSDMPFNDPDGYETDAADAPMGKLL
jgi:GNAT superfamily N-acetyltransferase